MDLCGTGTSDFSVRSTASRLGRLQVFLKVLGRLRLQTGGGSVLLAIRKFRLIVLRRIIQIPLIEVRLVTSIRYIRGFVE